MNILFLAYNVNIHSKTGDAVHVRELALNLAALGNKVSLVVSFNPDSKEDTSSLTNNSNIDLQYVKNPKMRYPRSRDVSILSLCFNIVKNNSFDIIYERNFSCRIGVILSKITRRPLIVEINGLVDEEAEMQGRHVSWIRGVLGKNLMQILFRQARKIVAVSPRIQDVLIEKYHISPEKIVIVPNGADTNVFKPLDKKKIQDELGLSHEFKYICFVGNLAPWQGVEYLINVAPTLLDKKPNVRFLIVGDGLMKTKWEKMVENRALSNKFLFIGSVPFEMVPKYINASDVCAALFTKNRKCSPIKVFEYLACAKPVILNDVENDLKMFSKLNSTFLVSFDDSNKSATELYNIISNDNLEQIGTEGREFIVENYTWENTARRVLELCTTEINLSK